MFQEAADELGKAFVLMGSSSEDAMRFSATLKAAYKTSGARAYWQMIAELLTTRASAMRVPVPPTLLAGFWAQAEEPDKAFALFEKAYQERDEGILHLKDPIFAPLRADPRYVDLLRRVGLPQD